uniref:PDZ domain-containing protein n=1 Tax=Cacopsylla melanoneura TaxID=428564 RepID=A0A8D8X2T5_9HEMI
MKRFSKNSSSRNSNKSLTLQSKSSDKALGFEEGKHGGITQRSLSMEHLNNTINLLSSAKSKDLKENGVDTHSSNSSMISSKTSSSDMLSLTRRKKQSSLVPQTPSVLSSRDYPQYPSNNSSNHTKQSSGTVLTNIENTLYNQQGHNNPTIQYTSNNSLYTSAPGVNSPNYTNSTTAPTSDSTNQHYESKITSAPSEIINSSAPGGDLKYIIVNSSSPLNENYTSAPSGNKLNQEQAEARLNKLRQELDRKRIFIKNMKMSLDTVDSSDNIDIRIQHAELEYQLGKEELNLLNILEEFRNLQNSIESNNNNKSGFGGYFHERLSIYNYIVKHCTASDALTLHAVQIPYDSKCPKFGLSYRDENNGLYVEWTSEEGGGLGLCKSDRILEINNHLIVQTNNRTELIKLLKLLPTTKLVVLRKAAKTLENDVTNQPPASSTAPSTTSESVPTTKIDRTDDAEKIQSDNVRLTHRISYLEEQVAELLAKVNKGQTFHTNNKLSSSGGSRTKNRYLETSLCSSEPYETKEYSSQRKLDAKYKDTRNLAEGDDEIEVFQKGNKIKTLLKNQKYAKEKLDKVLERTRKSVSAKENGECDDDSNNQRYNNTQRVDSEESTKENRHSLSRKYKTLEKCNPSKYHRRKKSEPSIVALNKPSTNGTMANASDTETYIPKIKSKSLIYLNKSQSDYNYPLAAPPSEKTVSSLTVNGGDSGSVNSEGRLSFEHTRDIDDDRYRKTYTFPIVKYNSDKNVRKIIDAKIYEENKSTNLSHQSLESRKSYDASLNHQSLDSRRSYDRLGEKDQSNFNELNRKLDYCNGESPHEEKLTFERSSDPIRKTDAKENDRIVRTDVRTNLANDSVGRNNSDTQSLERHGRLYVVDEAESSLRKHNGDMNQRNDTKIASQTSNKAKSENYPYGTKSDSNSFGTSRISIEFMDKPGHLRNNITRIGSDDRIGSKDRIDPDYYQSREPNNNVELYRIEKAIFNELHEECINKLDKSQSQRTVLPLVRNQSDARIQSDRNEQDNGSCKTNSVDETEDGDDYCTNQYDEFVRNKQSLDRIYDKYFQEPEHDSLGLHKDRHRYFANKQDILKNKFKNEKYVDIDNDNEIPLSKNVEKLNNNFKEFWKIKSYKKNCASPTCQSIDKIEKSQSETNFSDYERKLIGGGQDRSMFPAATTHEEVRKFNENTRMSKYELDDKLEKEKLQKSFLSNNHCRSKPIPPKKPARLSLQRAASLQSVNSIASVMTHNSDSQTKKPIKRNYKGDTSYLTVSLQNTGNERWC